MNTASLEWTSDGEDHILTTVQTAIRDWHVNHIRLPLSQDRWFGKAPEQSDKGKFYRILVRQVVDAVAAARCYIILDLHWSDAGEWGKNIGQHLMPDENSLTFLERRRRPPTRIIPPCSSTSTTSRTTWAGTSG